MARCGEPLQALITDAVFRPKAGVSDRLTTWAAWSSQSAKLDVATPSWVASGSCTPATCQSLGLECGEPSNGCGGNLSCGVCGRCESGVCIGDVVSVTGGPQGKNKQSSDPLEGGISKFVIERNWLTGGSYTI